MIEIQKEYQFIKGKNGKYKKIPKKTPEKSFDVLNEYISYDEIQKRLKKQKEDCQLNLFETQIVKTKTLPVNKNKFILHQYSFGDKRNKIHKEIQEQIGKLVNNGYLSNHVLLYGLTGSGKYTLGLYMLNTIYGGSIYNRIIRTKDINKREIKYIENPYYIEILINNYVINDNHTLSDFIKNNVKNKQSGICQYIIIKHFDKLTPQCQKSIAYLMEHLSNIRFILTTRNLSKITANITSNCHKIRVPRPEPKLLAKYMNRIAKSNNINITHTQIETIVRNSECNMNKALTTLELSLIDNSYIKTKDVHLKYIANLLEMATGPCMPNVRDIRDLISKLIITTYDVSEVYRTSVKLFMNSNFDDKIKHQVINIANKYSQFNNTTHNTIFVLEAFFLHIMRIFINMDSRKNYSLQKIVKNGKKIAN